MASPAPGQRPCPYCGNWNLAEYAFCGTCGKPLPPAADSPSVRATPASTPRAGDAGPVTERSLTGEERIRLEKALAAGRAGSLRGAAAVFSTLTLATVGSAYLGALTDAWIYLLAVVLLGMVGTALGAAARRERGALQQALASERAYELHGVPEVRAAEGQGTPVDLGGTTLLLGRGQASRLLPGRMNRVVLTDGGPGLGTDRKKGWRVGLVLEWNGQPAALERCHVAEGTPPDAEGQAEVLVAPILGGKA